MDKFIKVYFFEHAPQELKDLSNNGGDEDFVIICPLKYFDYEKIIINVVQRLTNYDYSEHKKIIDDMEYFVFITNH